MRLDYILIDQKILLPRSILISEAEKTPKGHVRILMDDLHGQVLGEHVTDPDGRRGFEWRLLLN